MQQVELHAKLLRQGDHFKGGCQYYRGVSGLTPYIWIASFERITIFMGEVINKLLIFRVEKRHHMPFAQNLKNARKITQPWDGGWRSGVPGGKDFYPGNQFLINLFQLIDIFERS